MSKYVAILPAIMGCLYLSNTHDFWRQLRTYTWRPESVVIDRNTLKAERMGFWDGGTMGEVQFKFDRAESDRRLTDHVSQRFDFDRSTTKTTAYISALAPGTRHTAYVSPDSSEVSLGHFPRSYGRDFAFAGAASLLLAAVVWWRGRAPAKPSEPSAQPS